MLCPHCRNEVGPSDAFCRHCGGGMPHLRFTPLVPGASPKPDKAPPWVHLVTVLVILGGGVALYMKFDGVFRNGSTPASTVTAPVGSVAPSQRPALETPPPAVPAAAAKKAAAPAPAKAVKNEIPGIPDAPPEPGRPSNSPVRVGGSIPMPTKVRDVKPVYPPMAAQARVQGIVIVEATIGADGSVNAARILRSIPLLDEAALAAVKQWQYTPTLVDGVPRAVMMTVTVQFTLK